MFVLYSVALFLVLFIGSPYWLFRMAFSGKYREGLSERLGFLPARLRKQEAHPVIWVHAVSVGEVLAASSLIAQLNARAHGYRVVVSTTTRTGQKIARDRFGADNVFYFPLDFAFAVRAYLKTLKPKLLVLLETEFWPRMLRECHKAQIPVAVVNARISDRSWPRYQKLSWFWRKLLSHTALVLAQSDEDAERLMAIGAANVQVSGNLKFDIRVARAAPVTQALSQFLAADQKVIVCGSTLEGEEEMLLDAVPPSCITILAPRHPERFMTVAHLLKKKNARWLRRSEWLRAPDKLRPGTVLLLDSIGELASVYSVASLAFIGGSLVPSGGHNPLEPAQFAIPILMGPHYENFRNMVEVLKSVQAIEIVSRENLRASIAGLLENSDAAAAMGERARAIFDSEAGGTDRTLTSLLLLVGDRA
jgi:3-deoxy-D-manno-octulosonic-acid transferase